MKYPEYVDVRFALRNPKEPSKIFGWENIEDNELLEKRVLTELGLSMYELPSEVVFVEGPTDESFFNKVLEKVKIVPRGGANIPKILSDIILSFPLARHKKYFVITDKREHKGVEKKITSTFKVKEIKVEALDLGFGSLEELIFGIDLDNEKTAIAWDKIEKKLEEFKKIVEGSEKVIFEINIKEARKKLEGKDREGLEIFFNSIKKRANFYEAIGGKWNLLLKGESKNNITKIKKAIEK